MTIQLVPLLKQGLLSTAASRIQNISLKA